MSLYVRVFTSFYSHRKTAKLRALIGDTALWLMPRLWAYAAENQPDGNFSSYSPAELANLIGFNGDAQAMLQAMLQAGFMDSDPLRIHDWEEHNGYHQLFAERARKAAVAKWDKVKNRVSPPTPPSDTDKKEKGNELSIASSSAKQCLGHPSSIPSSKFRKPTFEELQLHASKIGLPESEIPKFQGHYEANGWRVGNTPMKSWQAALGNWQRNWKERRYGTHNPADKPNPRNFGIALDATEQGRIIAETVARREREREANEANKKSV